MNEIKIIGKINELLYTATDRGPRMPGIAQ